MFKVFIMCAFVFGASHVLEHLPIKAAATPLVPTSVAFLLLLPMLCSGWTDDEVRMEFIKVLMKCTKDIKVEPQHLLSLQRKMMPDDPATRCLVACAYRRSGMMDDKGMFSKEGALKVSEKYYGDNPTKLESNKKFSDFCSKVNEEAVTDGEKGCERAGLMFKCLIDNAAKYGIKV